MTKERILILIDRLGRGGVAQVALNTALTLDREKYEPIICVTRDKPTNGQDVILKENGIQLIELKRNSRKQLFSWQSLREVLPTVTILHSHQSGSNFWARLWGKLYNVPIIITQEHTAANEKSQMMLTVDRLMKPLSNKVVAVSEFDRELYISYEGLPAEKVITVYNGIDVSRFSETLGQQKAREACNLPKKKYLIGVIARLAPQKNHHALFKALRLLPDDLLQDTQCLLIGSGDLKLDLEAEIKRLGLEEHISFLGERQDIPNILQAIDVLVLPSHWECLPMVLVEALAAKCPIVATKVGGVPEIIDTIGWPIVEVNDIEALASGISDVLQMSPEKKSLIADAGYERAQTIFSKEASVAQLESLYDSLLAEANIQ